MPARVHRFDNSLKANNQKSKMKKFPKTLNFVTCSMIKTQHCKFYSIVSLPCYIYSIVTLHCKIYSIVTSHCEIYSIVSILCKVKVLSLPH